MAIKKITTTIILGGEIKLSCGCPTRWYLVLGYWSSKEKYVDQVLVVDDAGVIRHQHCGKESHPVQGWDSDDLVLLGRLK